MSTGASYQVLGIDPADPSTMSASSHGLFALVGLLALAAPFAAPYWRDRRARWLPAAPLAFLVLTFIKFRWELGRMVSRAGEIGGSNSDFGQFASSMTHQAMQSITDAISPGIGLYLIVAASVVLAWMAWRQPTAAN